MLVLNSSLKDSKQWMPFSASLRLAGVPAGNIFIPMMTLVRSLIGSPSQRMNSTNFPSHWSMSLRTSNAMPASCGENTGSPAATVLIAAIETALAQAARADRGDLTAADAVGRLAALTQRERDVLDGMVLGRPNKLIAYDLSIATRTVEVHRANLMEKLSARSLSDVLRIAFAAGLGDPGDRA